MAGTALSTRETLPTLSSMPDVTIADFLNQIRGILDTVVPFIIGLAVFIVIWGIFNYITHAADEEKRAEARQYIIWGVVGVFFMLSIWGFVNILLNTFTLNRKIDQGDIPQVPDISTGNKRTSD